MSEEFVTPIRPPFDGLKKPEEVYPPGTEPPIQPYDAPTTPPATKPSDDQLSITPRELTQQTDPFADTVVDNTNKHFKGQHKNEFVHCFCRRHWIVLIPHFIGFFIFIIVIAGFLAFVSSANIQEIMSPFAYRTTAFVILALLTLYFHRFFNAMFNYYLRIKVITNFRVVTLDKTIFFTDNRDSIDIREIQDIVVNQKGIFQTVLNYGSIIITLSSAHATKILDCMPNPEYHFRKINKTKREYITARRTTKIIAPLPSTSRLTD